MGWLTVIFKVKLNLKVKIYRIWASLCHKSPPIEIKISKFGLKMHFSTVQVPIDFGLDWPWSSISFLISNMFFSTTFCVSYSFASVCIYLLRPSPVTVPHPTWLRACTDSSMHVDKIAPWTLKQSSCIYLVRPWQLGQLSIRRLAPDFTSCYRFSPNHTHFTCLNLIC